MTIEQTNAKRLGKIVTFYSYKGGTGRSMALANVAWILASSGFRVLAIDWDLEAPGLHRYFEPFIGDKKLESSTGLMDFFMRFVTAAVSGEGSSDPNWFHSYSNLLAHAMKVKFDFPGEGLLEFVPAGRQDGSYASRVNSFSWQNFYERLGGGVLLEDLKERLRSQYDYILIDSRTGVSDTSGVCTVQMPDELVVCFTLNRQSIHGAAGAARSAYNQRFANNRPTLKIWPVTTRVEASEKDRLEMARTIARTRFTSLLHHLNATQIDAYWGEISVAYEPYYAYEEVLSVFRDRPSDTGSMLVKMIAIAQKLSELPLAFEPLDEERRASGLNAFINTTATDHLEDFELLAKEYEAIRVSLPEGGRSRTLLMSQLLGRAQLLAGHEVGRVAEQLFRVNSDGCRIIGLGLANAQPQRTHIDLALDGIGHSRSAFEQYHALVLSTKIETLIDTTALNRLRIVIEQQLGNTITPEDQSRYSLATKLLESDLAIFTQDERESAPVRYKQIEIKIGRSLVTMNECSGPYSRCRYEDADEGHGPFVSTRGTHTLQIPKIFRISKFLVTNEVFYEFVADGGYQDDSLWSVSAEWRLQMLTADGRSQGPATWPTNDSWPNETRSHPVCGLSLMEAEAFVRWCNLKHAPENGWRWCLPHEDIWEYSARGEKGLTYPWGDAFEKSLCNSAEAGFGGTTDVRHFESVLSPFGCTDMAGNLWEFVHKERGNCIMRGGSYKNLMNEVRSYLRLSSVPAIHRAPDFGIRLAQAFGEDRDSIDKRPSMLDRARKVIRGEY